MLAGKIRLKTFMVGVGALVGVVGGGMVVGMASCADSITPRPIEPIGPLVGPQPLVPRPVRPEPARPAPSREAPDATATILAAVGKPLGASKRKDVTAGSPYKVNLYQDDGHATVNRAKVDHDRDESWDEKWTIRAGGIERQISSADDGTYDVVQEWDGARWVSAGEAAASPEPAATPGLRPVDTLALSYRGKDLGTGKLKDVTKGRPFKINVYQDDGHPSVNRVKLDLDRDDAWDEQWTFDGDAVQRKVAPSDDGDFTDVYRLTPDGWAR